eukprot:Clim_evm4s51 gene=Clim_evmTU4s51
MNPFRSAKAVSRVVAGGQRIIRPYSNNVAAATVGKAEDPVRIADHREALKLYKEGDNVGAYTITGVQEVPELQLTAITAKHNTTGTEHLHVARKDSNNVFAVRFRTTPTDSTGVAHILEHVALCGSKQFPIRDPFFKMLSRSVSTFMNAMTASDWTMYPFATQNAKDFDNLLSVYLDAAFFPLINEQDFRQEGWRLENKDPKDINSPWIFNGVVYNEMKGVYSDVESLYSQQARNALYPTSTYGWVSGGDPKFITDLSWDNLRKFHADHYHPSNSQFFTYGDLPLERHLEAIEQKALRHFQFNPVDTTVGPEQRWTAPQRKSGTCPVDDMSGAPQDQQSKFSVSILLNPLTDTYGTLKNQITSKLLLDGPNSPFYKSLLASNTLGQSYSPNTGYDTYAFETNFSVGLQGMQNTRVDEVESVIMDTFNDTVDKGFNRRRIDAILHQVELSQKHQSSSFGISLALGVACPWNHGADPFELLQVNRSIQRFKDDLDKNPRLLSDHLQENFVDNQHRLSFEMHPDTEFSAKLKAEEDARLQNIVGAQDKETLFKIHHENLDLLEAQKSKPDLSLLPELSLADIERGIVRNKITQQEFSDPLVKVNFVEAPTNAVGYFRAVLDASRVPEDLQVYLPLFSGMLTAMGTKETDYEKLSLIAEENTGGLSCGTHITGAIDDMDRFEHGITIGAHCLQEKIPKMLSIWSEIIRDFSIDDADRLQTLLGMMANDATNSIAGSGHAYAMRNSRVSLGPMYRLAEQYEGIEQVYFLQKLASEMDLPMIQSKIGEVSRILLNGHDMGGHIRCAVNGDEVTLSKAKSELKKFLSSIAKDAGAAASSGAPQPMSSLGMIPNNYHVMPFDVKYCAKSIVGVPYASEDYAPLQVLAKVMTDKFLHREIRETGGAYGGGCVMRSGVFSFYSYRDPNTVQTLQRFDASIDWATDSSSYGSAEVDEAKLSVLGDLDKPVSPGSQGLSFFLSGINDEMRQNHRDRIFAVSAEDLRRVAGRYLASAIAEDSSAAEGKVGMSIIGPEDAAEEFRGQRGWNIVTGGKDTSA